MPWMPIQRSTAGDRTCSSKLTQRVSDVQWHPGRIAQEEQTHGGTDQRNGVSFDQQDGSAVGGFQSRT